MTEQNPQVAEDVEETAPTVSASEPRIITPEVVPTDEEMVVICAEIKANFPLVNVMPVTFRFKESKDDNGVRTKRDAFDLPIPYPTVDGIVEILKNGNTEEGKKGMELLREAVNAVITAQARSLVTEDMSINATNLPVEKLAWDFIANMPKAERSGGGIAKEVWEAFAADYIEVIHELTGKDLEKVGRMASILKQKLAPVKTNKPILGFAVEQLTMYLEATPNAEDFTDCVAFLVDKADKLINATDEDLLANLM